MSLVVEPERPSMPAEVWLSADVRGVSCSKLRLSIRSTLATDNTSKASQARVQACSEDLYLRNSRTNGPSCLLSTFPVDHRGETAILTSVPPPRLRTSHQVSLHQSLQGHSSSRVCRFHYHPHAILVTGPHFTTSRQSESDTLPIGVQNQQLLRSLARIWQGVENTCIERGNPPPPCRWNSSSLATFSLSGLLTSWGGWHIIQEYEYSNMMR